VGNTDGLFIGNRGTLDRGFSGFISYTYVYNRALQPSEIKSLYESPYQFIKPVTHRFYSIGGVTPPETFMANLYFM
jgi:hypothetical protein